MNTTFVSPSEEEVVIKYVCGIDVGNQSCSGCVCQPNKHVVIKPSMFANTKDGWNVLLVRLEQLEAKPNQIVIGMEATARYHENLYHELEQRGYQLRLLHPGQTHHFHQQQGLRAKTDRLDAMTIARLLRKPEKSVWATFPVSKSLPTEKWFVCVRNESKEVARYQNQIHALVVVLFPELTQVITDPCGPAALAVLKVYPCAQAVAQAGVKAVSQVLKAVPAAQNGASHGGEIGCGRSNISREQSRCEWTRQQLTHPVRPTRAYPGQSQQTGTGGGAIDGDRSCDKRLATDARVGSPNGSGLTCGTGGSGTVCPH